MKATQESKTPEARKAPQESKVPYDSKLNKHIQFTIIIIYEVPNCTNWKAADHIFTMYDLKESYDMILSGTT